MINYLDFRTMWLQFSLQNSFRKRNARGTEEYYAIWNGIPFLKCNDGKIPNFDAAYKTENV